MMARTRIVATVLAVVLGAATVAAFVVTMDSTKTSAWRDAFHLRLESVRARGLPTSYAALNARRAPLSPEENGAGPLPGLLPQYRELVQGAPGPFFDPFPNLLDVEGAKSEVQEAARALLRDQAGRLHGMWETLDQASEAKAIQGGYAHTTNIVGGLTHAMDCIPPLLVLRAWAYPDREIEFAITMLRLADRIEHNGGYYYFQREDLLREGLQIFRLAVERGTRPTTEESAVLRSLLKGFTTEAVEDLRRAPAFYRVYWAHYADPTLDRWGWISNYDHFGEGWTLYRDMLRAFDSMAVIETELESEGGVRAIGSRDEVVASWNSQLPSIGYIAGEALEVLTMLRLATLALDAMALLEQGRAPRLERQALASRLLSNAEPDALTGEAFVVHEEGPLLFLSVPWRETDFSLRPPFVRSPWQTDGEEPAPTWAEDSLRDDGWIWMIRQR